MKWQEHLTSYLILIGSLVLLQYGHPHIAAVGFIIALGMFLFILVGDMEL